MLTFQNRRNMIWFISDLHFYHRNIIRWGRRPFRDIWHMHDIMIKNWNSKVKPDDTVYVVGDMFMGVGMGKATEIMSKLNGYKILIKGNHDKYNHSRILRMGFKEYYDQKELDIDGKSILLCHYPYKMKLIHKIKHILRNFYKFWRRTRFPAFRYQDKCPTPKGKWLIHGHTHQGGQKINRNRKMINVNVEYWNYSPVSLLDIEEIIYKREG